MHVYKTIIIGAGVAGLAAAKFFHDHGFHDFLILEAQDYIGGRVRTAEFGTIRAVKGQKGKVELGAQWIHGEDNDFFRQIQHCQEIHVKTSWEGEGEFRTPEGVEIPQEKVQRILQWVNDVLDGIEESPEELVITEIHGNENSSENPGVKSQKEYSNNQVIQGHGVEHESVGSYVKRKFMEFLDSDNHGLDDVPRNLQMAIFQWAMSFQRIDNACNQMTDLSLKSWPDFLVNDGELYNNFKSGATQALQKLSGPFLNPGNVKYNSPVTRILWHTEEIQVFTTGTSESLNQEDVPFGKEQSHGNDHHQNNQREEIYLCQSLFITCSMGVLQKVKSTMFSPELPPMMSTAIDLTGFGPLTKIYLEWEEPWWSEGFRGIQLLWPDEFLDCCEGDDLLGREEEVIKVRAGGAKPRAVNGWVKAITGFDPVLDNPRVLLAWLGGPEAVVVENLPLDVVIRDCAKTLSQFLGREISAPVSAVVTKWNSNPYIRGAYCYRSLEGDKFPGEDLISTLKLPIFIQDDFGIAKPSLIFAGEALHESQYSTLHGAFASGQEQAGLLMELYQQWEAQRQGVDMLINGHEGHATSV